MTRPTREHGTAPIVDVCPACDGDDWYLLHACATCQGRGEVCTHCRVWPCECEQVAADYAADIASEES